MSRAGFHSCPVFLLGILLPVWLVNLAAEEKTPLPPISAKLVEKLEAWEKGKREEYDTEILEKRNEVISVLRKHLIEVTSSGNLDGALAIKAKIGELEGKNVELTPRNQRLPGAEFAKWIRSIRMREVEGWWEVEDDEVVQHLDTGGIKRFACKINSSENEVSFTANGRIYVLQFLPDRSRGIRSRNDDWPARAFWVEPGD